MSATITCARCEASITSEDLGEALTWSATHDEFCPTLIEHANGAKMPEPMPENRLNFARTLTDPDFSLSVPVVAKQIIRELLAEVERLVHQPTEPCPGCDCDPIGYAPHNGKGTLCTKPTELEPE